MREVKYHPKASAEALHSARYYNRRQPGLGAEFFDELDRTVAQVREDPLCFPADADGIRSWRLRRFPFRAYYIIEPDRIRILAVAHLRRRPGYWRERTND
jgi:plasmid stabilization system protein ParE